MNFEDNGAGHFVLPALPGGEAFIYIFATLVLFSFPVAGAFDRGGFLFGFVGVDGQFEDGGFQFVLFFFLGVQVLILVAGFLELDVVPVARGCLRACFVVFYVFLAVVEFLGLTVAGRNGLIRVIRLFYHCTE